MDWKLVGVGLPDIQHCQNEPCLEKGTRTDGSQVSSNLTNGGKERKKEKKK